MKTSWTKKMLLASLLSAWAFMPTQQASAEDSADEGEGASFEALDTTMDHDGGSSDELEPECMDCDDMLMTEAATASMLKAGARPPKVRKLASDRARMLMMLRKPAFVKAGPSPKVSNRNSKLFKVKPTARPVVGAVMVDLDIEINPKARNSFPDATDPMACNPTKPFNRLQKGWFPIKTSSTYVTKTGFKGATRPQTTYLCIHKPTPVKPACTLTCGAGSCQQSFDGAKWTSACVCSAGYKLNAAGTCADVNECLATKSPCTNGATCTNTTGSYTCGCTGGKIASARGCVTPPAPSCANTCTTTQGGICLLTKTSATCTCRAGEKFDSQGVCQSLRQCAKDSCGPGSKCTDASSPGSTVPVGDIRCSLPPGTAPRLAFATPLGTNKKGAPTFFRQPLDIDECKLPSVRLACGKNKCVNIDRSSPRIIPNAPGATCGTKKFPPAPSPNHVWNNAGNGSWTLPL